MKSILPLYFHQNNLFFIIKGIWSGRSRRKMDFYFITVGSFALIIILSLFIILGLSSKIQKNDQELIQEDAINQGIKDKSIQILLGYRSRLHYHVLYVDEKFVGHVRECIVYKKMVYWYDPKNE
jgi:hypothetical protein